ncbi:MAG TPA: hypothetical protein VJ921_11120, partial [Vicinamibacteria bacterium]|nr:hypothetical protein [Vicinamibacteria bacterium]
MTRRWLYPAARALSLTAGLLGLLLLFLHSAPMADWLRRSLVTRLSSLGAVSMGSLEYRLWRGEVEARTVRIEPAGEGTVLSVDIEEVRGRWVPFRQLDVTVVRPVVHLRANASAAEPARVEVVEPSVPPWISSLRIEEG